VPWPDPVMVPTKESGPPTPSLGEVVVALSG